MTHHSSQQTLLTDKNGRSCDPQELADHIRALRRYAYALVGRSANADDFVQETLRRAISHLREGKEIHNLRSYLLTILHNVRNDHIKHERRYGEMLVVDEDLRL